VAVVVVELRPNTARVRYRRWDGVIVNRFVKRNKLRLHQEQGQ
jgi:hypothetical protein